MDLQQVRGTIQRRFLGCRKSAIKSKQESRGRFSAGATRQVQPTTMLGCLASETTIISHRDNGLGKQILGGSLARHVPVVASGVIGGV